MMNLQQKLTEAAERARQHDRARRQAALAAPSGGEHAPTVEARIIDVRMPFWSMVFFMVKLAFAAIPAMLILSVAYGGMLAFISAMTAWLR